MTLSTLLKVFLTTASVVARLSFHPPPPFTSPHPSSPTLPARGVGAAGHLCTSVWGGWEGGEWESGGGGQIARGRQCPLSLHLPALSSSGRKNLAFHASPLMAGHSRIFLLPTLLSLSSVALFLSLRRVAKASPPSWPGYVVPLIAGNGPNTSVALPHHIEESSSRRKGRVSSIWQIV